MPDEIEVDAPTSIVWEHTNGIRGIWDITLALDLYLRSDYYTNDERWEVTGQRGYARVNRCTGRGIQQPSLEVYVDGEMRGYHALDDDWASSFRDSGRHWLRWLHTRNGPLLWSAQEALEVLGFALAVYASSAAGGIGSRRRASSSGALALFRLFLGDGDLLVGHKLQQGWLALFGGVDASPQGGDDVARIGDPLAVAAKRLGHVRIMAGNVGRPVLRL